MLDASSEARNAAHRLQAFEPVRLPCGVTVQNCLVKAAMYEHLASFLGGPPNEYHFALYSQWAMHPWGMIFTGNVEVSDRHLSLGRDLVVPKLLSTEHIEPYRKLAAVIHGQHGCKAIMQLNHTGRQSGNIIGGRAPFEGPLAPSAIHLGSDTNKSIVSGIFHWLLFQMPRPMSITDIDTVVQEFVRGALLAVQSNFDGIELHVAHGYLLAQFLSPKSNKRTDEYSVAEENCLRLLHRIIRSIREQVPSSFIIGIKLNASDYVDSNIEKLSHLETQFHDAQEEHALQHILTIANWEYLDFIEVSGGDYETPDFLTSDPSSSRQAFFSKFSHQAVQLIDSLSQHNPQIKYPRVMLTGGFRSPSLIHNALRCHSAHLVGIGRGACICPNIPGRISDLDNVSQIFAEEPVIEETSWIPRIPLIGAGMSMAWYIVTMRRLAGGLAPDYCVSGIQGVFLMWIWVTPSEAVVLKKIFIWAVVVSTLIITLSSSLYKGLLL